MVTTLLVVVLCGGLDVFGGFHKRFSFPFTEVLPLTPMDHNFGKYSHRGLCYGFKKYYSLADTDEEEMLNVIPHFRRLDLSKIRNGKISDIFGKSLLLVTTMRHRDKRFASYLTLCPFKVCNMGHKKRKIRNLKGDTIERRR